MKKYPVNAALEAAVIASAEDDTPRLAYADWLDENGDPDRAAFIRNQVGLWNKHPADPDYADLVEQRLELQSRMLTYTSVKRLKPKARNKLISFYDSNDGERDDEHTGFHRGFPYFVGEPSVEGGHPGRTHARRFRDALPEIVRTTTLRGFNFYGSLSRQLDVILDTPSVAHFSALVADNSLSEGVPPVPAIRSILDSPIRDSLAWFNLGSVTEKTETLQLAGARLPRLRRFTCHSVNASPSPLKKLIASEGFARLNRALLCFAPGNGAAGVAALADLPDLHTFEFWLPPSEAIAALRNAKPFRALGRLQIHVGSLLGDGTAALARAKMPNLASLELVRCSVRNDEMKLLASCSLFERLVELSLPGNQLGDQGVATIADSPCARSLRILKLGDNAFGKRGLSAIAKPGTFPSLTTLDLDSSLKRKADASETTEFLRTLAIPGLRHLKLNRWPVDDAGASAIASNPAFANLTRLDLSGANVGKAGLRALAASPYLRKLVYLGLTSNPCQTSADVLLDPGAFPALAECWITSLNDPIQERLKKARPRVAWY